MGDRKEWEGGRGEVSGGGGVAGSGEYEVHGLHLPVRAK